MQTRCNGYFMNLVLLQFLPGAVVKTVSGKIGYYMGSDVSHKICYIAFPGNPMMQYYYPNGKSIDGSNEPLDLSI